MPADPLGYAEALYRTLHRLDGEGLAWIAVDRPPGTPRLGRRARPPAPGGKQSLTNRRAGFRAVSEKVNTTAPINLQSEPRP
jgi:hypothetical protein